MQVNGKLQVARKAQEKRRISDGDDKMVERFKPDYKCGAETFLKKVIDTECVEMAKETKKVLGSLYASDYGQCMRKIYHQFFPNEYAKAEFGPRLIRIFQNGDSVHERLSAYLHRNKSIQFIEEVDVPRDELDVHGRCDGLCVVESQLVVTEFKSINRTSVYVAKEEHLGQVTWYMGMWRMYREALRGRLGFGTDGSRAITVQEIEGLGEQFDELADFEKLMLLTQGEVQGEIIMESKQSQEIFAFPVIWNEDRFKKVKLWFQQLDWHVKNKIIPKVNYDQNKFPCRWAIGKKTEGQCDYFDTCYPNGSGM